MAPFDAGTVDLLQGLQAVTDTNLSKLDLTDFLDELLGRVRVILQADTAAILLFDETSNQLVATAAQGIEEEVRQGVRIPVGTGFAGTIALRRQPVLIDEVSPATVANPILWEKGIQVMLGVPLLAHDRLLGVLHVGRLVKRPFNNSDAQLLQVVAERVSGATQSLRLAMERTAASLVERSLLPGRMPQCAGLEFAVRYLTPEGSSVGGDWYDGFLSPAGSLWVVVGDVAGRGLPAAVVMGRIKSALRAYALLDLPAEEVLELTARKISHFETDALATVVCAVSSPPFRQFHIASAGHLPPVVAPPSGPAQLVAIPVSPPLGSPRFGTPGFATVTLEPGGLMFLYTDGLVERRDEDLPVGIERLRSLVVPESPELACRRVINGFFGGSSPRDDVAMVALRCTDADAG